MRWLAGLLGSIWLLTAAQADEVPKAEMLIFLGEMMDAQGDWLGPDDAEALEALASSEESGAREIQTRPTPVEAKHDD